MEVTYYYFGGVALSWNEAGVTSMVLDVAGSNVSLGSGWQVVEVPAGSVGVVTGYVNGLPANFGAVDARFSGQYALLAGLALGLSIFLTGKLLEKLGWFTRHA